MKSILPPFGNILMVVTPAVQYLPLAIKPPSFKSDINDEDVEYSNIVLSLNLVKMAGFKLLFRNELL